MRKSNGYRSSTSDPNTPLGRMEHLADITRLHKSLKRPPQQRTGSDIERIMTGTHQVAALHEGGESVRRDLCYVMQCVHLDKGKLVTFKDLPGAGEAVFMVLCGSVTVDTSNPDMFSSCLSSGDAEAQKEPDVVLSDADLRELFDTLDEDKSGSIDAMEFMHALEMLGLEVAWSEMEEAIQAVDTDGSGSLEFPEFKIVMEEKLGFGKRGPQGWQQNTKGDKSSGSHRTYYDGETFGDRALLKDIVLIGSISAATQDPVVAVLTRADYHHILQNGFKGDLSRKLDYVKTSPLLQEILHNTELKHLAQSCELKTCPAKTELFRQGSKPKALLFLLEGQVKILRTVHIDVDPVLANRSTHSSPRGHVTNQQTGNRRPRPPPDKKCTRKRQFQVAQLAGVDVISEGIFAKDKKNMYTHSFSAVALTEVLIMELPTPSLYDVLNPSDIDKILDHATLKKSWWLEHTKKCSAVQSSQLASQMDLSAAAQARERISVDEKERETASSTGILQRTFSPPRKFSYGADYLAQAQQRQKAPKGTMGLWVGNGTGIPVDCIETDQERRARETAEISFTNSVRTEMTGFLNRIQPGKPVLTQDLADDPQAQAGWMDVRTNTAENMIALQAGRPCTLRQPFQGSAAASTKNFASLALAKSLDASLGRTSGVVAAMDRTHVPKPRRVLMEEALQRTGGREGKRERPRIHMSVKNSDASRPSSRASALGGAHLQSRASSRHRLGSKEGTVLFRTSATNITASGRHESGSVQSPRFMTASSQGHTTSSRSLKIATSWGHVQGPKANFPQELAAGLDLALTVRPSTAGEKSAAVATAPQMPPRPSTSHTTLRPATAPELGSNDFSPLFMARQGNEAWRATPPPAAVSRTCSTPRRGRLVTSATRLLVDDMLPSPRHAYDDQKGPGASEISKRAAAILKGTALR